MKPKVIRRKVFLLSTVFPASRFDGRFPAQARGAGGGSEGGHVERGERDARDAYVGSSAGTVNDGSRADDSRARRAESVNRLTRRAARRYHVFDDEDAFSGAHAEATPERHLSRRVAFRPERTRAECARGFVADNDAPDGRSSHRFDALLLEVRGDGFTEGLRFRRILKHQRTL